MLGYILTLITPPPADNVYGRYIEITLSIKSVPGTNQYSAIRIKFLAH